MAGSVDCHCKTTATQVVEILCVAVVFCTVLEVVVVAALGIGRSRSISSSSSMSSPMCPTLPLIFVRCSVYVCFSCARVGVGTPPGMLYGEL